MTTIPLHGKPGMKTRQIVGTVIGANLFILSLSAVFFGLIPFLTETKPDIGTFEFVVLGFLDVAIIVGAVIWTLRRQFKRGFGHPVASLIRDGDTIVVKELATGRTLVESDIESLPVRRVLAQEGRGQTEFYVGPGLEWVGEERWVIASLDGEHRWEGDLPTALNVRYICPRDKVVELARLCDIDARLVGYGS